MKGSKATILPDVFIFTEVIHCGVIGYHALASFRRYHPGIPVHVFGLHDDFLPLKNIPHLVFHDLGNNPTSIGSKFREYRDSVYHRLTETIPDSWIVSGYTRGHLGTARLWAKIIKERPEPYMFHFDSDVVFRGEVLSEFREKIAQGYHLIGRYRNYRHNPNNRDDVRHLPDVCQTVLFAFDKRKIRPYSSANLIAMCQGAYNPLGFSVIDFFDPVMFDIIDNGGKVFFLSSDKYGGCDAYGKRDNAYARMNSIIDFGSHFAHFSSVGSGRNFFENADAIVGVPYSYRTYALEKYAIYMKLLYNTDIGVSYKKELYQPLFTIKKWY